MFPKWLPVVTILSGLGILTGLVSQSSSWDYISLAFSHGPASMKCAAPQYNIHVISYDPLLLHIENFITEEERHHLLRIADPLYKRSMVTAQTSAGTLSTRRTSSTARLPSNDSVVRCVAQRAAEFQGFVPVESIEPLQATRYEPGQHYAPHYDWSVAKDRHNETNGRITSFFAILEASCTECSTKFPRLLFDWEQEDERICQYVDCGADSVAIRPVNGSAVFWRNVLENGHGDERTLHAGLRVMNGSKVGLNIWTRPEQ